MSVRADRPSAIDGRTDRRKRFEVTREGTLPAVPAEVWDAFTRRTAGWLWEISYEPRAGGATWTTRWRWPG